MQSNPRATTVSAVMLAISLIACVGCHRDTQTTDELRAEHRQILSRLADLEQKIDRLSSRPASPQRSVGPDAARTYNLPIEGSPVKGPADAPVTIVALSAYQCPFCARSEPLIGEALQAYPTQVRFVYKHFPLTANHPQ